MPKRGFRYRFLLVCLASFLVPTGALAAQTMDTKLFTFIQAEQLEFVSGGGDPAIEWDGQAWVGGDFTKLWIKTEGEFETEESMGDFEAQVLYSRMIASYWDFQAGLRVDSRFGGLTNNSRALFVVGFQGLAPYWFELAPAVFISQDGDVSARLVAGYDILLSQRLIVEPELELNLGAQAVPELALGSGIRDLELAIRARYEFKKEFAPYVGFSWITQRGGTADFVRTQGKSTRTGRLVIGVRAWY